MFFFQFCIKAREAIRGRAIEIYPVVCDEGGSLTDGMSSENDILSHESWLEQTCEALRRNELNELGLDASNQILDCAGIAAMSDAVRQSQTVTRLRLRNVELDQNQISGPQSMLPILNSAHLASAVRLEDSGEEALIEVAKFLTHASRKITALHLEENVVCPKCAQAIGDMLQHNRSIQELSFCHNGITSESFSSIARDLKMNRTLQSLDLVGNAIDDIDVAKLADALVCNEYISFLCLDFNNFSHLGMHLIASVLCRNSSLTEIHLFRNRIDARGAASLAASLAAALLIKN